MLWMCRRVLAARAAAGGNWAPGPRRSRGLRAQHVGVRDLYGHRVCAVQSEQYIVGGDR